MPKVTGPLFSQEARGAFANRIIFKRGGIAVNFFKPRDPRTAAQLAARQAFKDFVMGNLTQEQADLLYSAITHLHTGVYAPSSHAHDHGDSGGLSDDDHPHYFNQTRGDSRYSLGGHNHDSAYAAIGHDHDADYAEIGHTHSGLLIAGMIFPYGGSSAPSGFLLCDGQSWLRSVYADLFAVLGTTYGSVDGTHFNVPDLRGRAPIGAGTGTGGGASGSGLPAGGSALTARARGDWLGEEAHQLSVAELAAHSHNRNTVGAIGTSTAQIARGSVVNSGNIQVTDSAGGDSAHNNIQPVMTLNFVIKT